LVGPQPIDPRHGRVPLRDVLSEEPRETVHGVRGREQRSLPLLREPERRGPGHRGLADPALAAKEGVLEPRALGEITRHGRPDRDLCADALGLHHEPSCNSRRASRSIIPSPVASRSISGTYASTSWPNVPLISSMYF